MVTVVSVVIWIYAERRNPAVPLERPITLNLRRVEGNDLIARLVEPDRRYFVEFTGATNELAELKQRLSESGDKITLTVGDEISSDTGERAYPLREILARHDWFRDGAIALSEGQVQMVRVFVDRWVGEEAPVEVQPWDDLSIVGSVQIDPPTLPIQVAETLARSLGPGSIRLSAELPDEVRSSLIEGQSNTVEAPVRILGGYSSNQVRLGDEKKVRLTFTLASRHQELAWGPVPIKLVILPRDQSMYDVRLTSPVIASVTLAGPSEVIAKVQSKETKIFGYLDLDSVELSNGIGRKRVSFDHLTGLTVLSGPHEAEFEIVKLAPTNNP